ncbi:uncharacterized protein ACNS7B_023392 isoform 2-T2 [Menidia menidia]
MDLFHKQTSHKASPRMSREVSFGSASVQLKDTAPRMLRSGTAAAWGCNSSPGVAGTPAEAAVPSPASRGKAACCRPPPAASAAVRCSASGYELHGFPVPELLLRVDERASNGT